MDLGSASYFEIPWTQLNNYCNIYQTYFIENYLHSVGNK